jgi:predicted Zn-dependent peptidase
VLTLVGDFDAKQARDLVDRYFGEIPRGPAIPPIPGRTELPALLGREMRATVEQDISLARVYLGYRTPRYGTDEFYASFVASYILATGRAALLYRTLVRERQLAQDVIAYAFPVVVGASMFVVWATARPDVGIGVLEEATRDTVEALAHVGDDDVARALAMIEARHLADLQTVDERADQLSMYTTLFDDPDRINTELDRIRAVTADDVRRFAAQYLRADNRAVLCYVPRAEAVT